MLAALERAGWPNQPLPAHRPTPAVSDESRPTVTAIRRPNRKLKPAQIDDLVARYQAGAPMLALAAQFGIHPQTVRSHLTKRAVPIRPMIALQGAAARRAVELYRTGMPLAQIATRFGVTPTAVRSALRRTECH